MSYLSLETSAASGAPVLLYQFVAGDQVWRLTAAAEEMSYAGETWTPSAVSHGEITQSTELNKDGLSLEFPRTEAIAAEFLGYAPDAVVSVTVFRKHRGDDEAVVYWRGRVVSSMAEGERVTLECESVFTSLRRPGLRARYQRSCRHALYGRGCGVDKTAHAVEGELTEVAQNTVTVPVAAAEDDGHYLGGMLEFAGIFRMITGHAGAVLTLSRPIQSLGEALVESGYGGSYGEHYGAMTVKIYPGCDRTRATCDGKFSNLDNFGGFSWIPLKNPFGGSSLV